MRGSLIRSFILLVMLILMVGLATSQTPTPTPTSTAIFGKDQSARKQNSPALFDALGRYVRADKALRAEFLSYQSEMDVDYQRIKPLLDELHKSLDDADAILRNFDEARAQALQEKATPDAPEG